MIPHRFFSFSNHAALFLLSLYSSVCAMTDDEIKKGFQAYRQANLSAKSLSYLSHLSQQAEKEDDNEIAIGVLRVFGKIKPFTVGKTLKKDSDDENLAYETLFRSLDVFYAHHWESIQEEEKDGAKAAFLFFGRAFFGKIKAFIDPDPTPNTDCLRYRTHIERLLQATVSFLVRKDAIKNAPLLPWDFKNQLFDQRISLDPKNNSYNAKGLDGCSNSDFFLKIPHIWLAHKKGYADAAPMAYLCKYRENQIENATGEWVLDLPNDILGNISLFLTSQDFISLGSVSKHLKDLCDNAQKMRPVVLRTSPSTYSMWHIYAPWFHRVFKDNNDFLSNITEATIPYTVPDVLFYQLSLLEKVQKVTLKSIRQIEGWKLDQIKHYRKVYNGEQDPYKQNPPYMKKPDLQNLHVLAFCQEGFIGDESTLKYIFEEIFMGAPNLKKVQLTFNFCHDVIQPEYGEAFPNTKEYYLINHYVSCAPLHVSFKNAAKNNLNLGRTITKFIKFLEKRPNVEVVCPEFVMNLVSVDIADNGHFQPLYQPPLLEAPLDILSFNQKIQQAEKDLTMFLQKKWPTLQIDFSTQRARTSKDDPKPIDRVMDPFIYPNAVKYEKVTFSFPG